MLAAPDAPPRHHTFDGLAEAVVETCRQLAHPIHAKRGTVMMRQGEKATRVYVIRDGYAKLTSTSPDGHEVVVGVIGPLDVFGQMALIEPEGEYLVTATALTPLELLSWTRAEGLELSRRFPQIHERLDAEMARNIETVLKRIHSVSEGRVPQRLARAVLELAERHGTHGEDGILIEPPLTRQDAAALVGTTLFTASRLLSDWQSQGLLKTSRGRVRILSTEGLRAIADSD